MRKCSLSICGLRHQQSERMQPIRTLPYDLIQRLDKIATQFSLHSYSVPSFAHFLQYTRLHTFARRRTIHHPNNKRQRRYNYALNIWHSTSPHSDVANFSTVYSPSSCNVRSTSITAFLHPPPHPCAMEKVTSLQSTCLLLDILQHASSRQNAECHT